MLRKTAVMVVLALFPVTLLAEDVERRGAQDDPKQVGESTELANVHQVRREANEAGKWIDSPLACYIVPPISSVKRLPDAIPDDGRLDDVLRVIAAKDAYESASFVIVPYTDLEDVEITVSDLHNEGDILPSSTVDVRLVKSWYKGGTAWHSYFSDPHRRTLVPELLLHDQDLIRVDEQRQENYLRIDYPDGAEYRWVSYPRELSGNLDVFNHASEPVRDADRLQPFRLEAGRAQQMWVTVQVPKDTTGGLYTGSVTIAVPGEFSEQMELRLRVLPFVLPEPKTYYAPNRPFHTIIYNSTNFSYYEELLGDDRDAIERQILAELENMRRHNLKSPLLRLFDAPHHGRRYLQLMRKAGMALAPVFTSSNFRHWKDIFQYGNHGNKIPPARLEHLASIVESEKEVVEEELGHQDMYAIGWDEPGRATLRSQQPLIGLLHDEGLKYYSTAKDWHLSAAGFNEDAVNLSGKVTRERARRWHALGAKVFSYAYPHTGPENPEFIRRTHGLGLYKNDYDGTANYRYYGYRQNPWNDFTNASYRIRFVYPTSEGVIDTLHWVGFREGIDDVRYATKLRELAAKAIEKGGRSNRYAATKALRYLELLDESTADLNAARLEMINHILRIKETLEGSN